MRARSIGTEHAIMEKAPSAMPKMWRLILAPAAGQLWIFVTEGGGVLTVVFVADGEQCHDLYY